MEPIYGVFAARSKAYALAHGHEKKFESLSRGQVEKREAKWQRDGLFTWRLASDLLHLRAKARQRKPKR
jgi:hypothetical protein